ncbi:tRNA(Met) cytidine acetyltransferase TmcA [Geoglobus acetivorans]|uniref:tRNA(Met) cytidine acetyltransferase TmcA n=1 Tax=Geoglobus acetivorans TaxID=565033 RepID=A0A0A7GCX2_GEOAI|nr:P-loop ATPase fused to an acetyltransferase [Geoglobus acetivorans]
MTVRDLMLEIEKASKIARENRHRYVVFVCTKELNDRIMKLARKAYRQHLKSSENSEESLLLAGRSYFNELAEKYFNGEVIHYKDSWKVLGQTYDSLIIDLTDGFHPNDLGILIETIREGGIIIAISPHIDSWFELKGKWHEDLVSEPYTVDDVVPRFYSRFIKKTLGAEGIIIFDADKRKILKKYEFEKKVDSREEIVIPEEKKEIKRKLYKLCATQDQVRVLQVFESFFEKEREKKAVVITANRGRGKTAVLGILTPYLVSKLERTLKRPVRILLVAPNVQSVQTYFEFLKKALVRQGMKNFTEKKSGGNTTVINSRYARIEYALPARAMREGEFADIVIVDEAASIDVPVLFKIIEGVKYAIFSTTVHGYEGTGRGFAIRFLKRLEQDENTEIVKIELKEPIRYGKGDPIEAWLYDVLMLDAQPVELDEEDLEKIRNGELEFEELDKNMLIENDDLLREFFGIYVLAHYRNRPSDLVILLDMPNHIPLRVKVNGKTVCSLHVAVEGGMDEETVRKLSDGYKPKGQIIPDLILKHYWEYGFPELTGIRIVRIATHPSVMDMGIGSYALQKLVEWASEKDMDWAGSGFGVSPELLRFWERNGFVPVHITPQRNEISGEYTVIVLKALKMHIQSRIDDINAEFVRRVIEYLGDELRDIELETAIRLLRSLRKEAKACEPEFTRVERRRMKKYFQGHSLFEYVSDIARPLIRYYYTRADKAGLDEREERVLVAKCLMMKSWREIEDSRSYKRMLKALKKVWEWYHGAEED